MSEGTAREIVAKAAWEAYTGYVTRIPWDQANYFKRSGHERIADAVLAALREAGALAPAGLTGDERSERYIVLEKATLLRWRDIADTTATTLSAEIDRELWIAEPREDAAPAADAATGAPS